jgi:NTP pyrophosphatase (non-canonical NTP hydrolase)
MNRPANQFDLVVQQHAHSRELDDVFTERHRQLRKFGPQNRPPFEWFLILSEELGEVAKECVEMQFDDAKHPYADPERYYKELTEVAAVALAAMQNFNQRRGVPQCFHAEDDGGCSLCSRPAPEPVQVQVFPPACPRCLQRGAECLCPPMFPGEQPPF